MKVRNCFGVVAAAVLGFAGVAGAADTYKVDPVHSNVVFKITHFNMAPFYGLFVGPSGQFVLDEDAARSSFQFEVPVEKVVTGQEKRDAHLKGPDFFNAKQFPTISFKSTSVAKKGENAYEVTGDLTARGVTKQAVVTIEKTGQGKDPQGKERAGLHATFTIKRSDFGINYMPQGLGDEVTLMVGIEGLKQ